MKATTIVTIAATEARCRFPDLMNDVTQKDKVFRIHHCSGDVVLISKDYYEGLLESLELMSIPGFRESIQRSTKQAKRNQTFSFEEVFKDSQGRKKNI